MTDFNEQTPAGRGSPRTAEIESEIHRTRDRMGHELEAIGDKFRPERIKQRAKEAMSRKGASVFRTAKENPIPTALVALGLTMLFKARGKHNNGGNGYTYDHEYESGRADHEGLRERTRELAGDAREKVQDVAGAAREKVSHAAEQVGRKARRTGNTLQEFFESNPIIAGAGVVVLGAAVGALIPETRKENQLMGRARDEIVERTKSIAQHAQGAIEQKMSEGGSRGGYQGQ